MFYLLITRYFSWLASRNPLFRYTSLHFSSLNLFIRERRKSLPFQDKEIKKIEKFIKPNVYKFNIDFGKRERNKCHTGNRNRMRAFNPVERRLIKHSTNRDELLELSVFHFICWLFFFRSLSFPFLLFFPKMTNKVRKNELLYIKIWQQKSNMHGRNRQIFKSAKYMPLVFLCLFAFSVFDRLRRCSEYLHFVFLFCVFFRFLVI